MGMARARHRYADGLLQIYSWLCFRSNFKSFYERAIGQGSQNVDILVIYDPKNRVFDKKHTFGEIVMSKNIEMCNFSEKKAPAGATTD